MAEAQLERTVRFRAAHHYRRADRSPAENRATFGAVAEPHWHDWSVTVTVAGEIDADGFLVDLPALDRALADAVGALDRADLNEAVPEVRTGRLQPTTEALARWLWGRLVGAVPPPARLLRVRVAEGDALAAVWEG